MNIELNFLQKAIKDRNYISFTYKNIKYKKIKPLGLIQKENYLLESHSGYFDYYLITKLIILKERF